jgi:hypothetical protein
VVIVTAAFVDCTFQNCQALGASDPDNMGGAVLVDASTVSLLISGCRFAECRAIAGGALLGRYCPWFSMRDTTGVACWAQNYGGFFSVHLRSTASGWLDVSEISCLSSSSGFDSIFMRFMMYPSGSTSVVESLNSSANDAFFSGSGLREDGHFHLSMHFCAFSRNLPANCVELVTIISSNVTCLAFTNNSCQSHVNLPGLLYSSLPLLSDCVFQANVFDYFIAGPPGVVVFFVGCVFDGQTLRATNGVTFSIVGQTDVAHCATRTPLRSRTATKSPTMSRTPDPTPTSSLSMSPKPTVSTSRTPLPSPTVVRSRTPTHSRAPVVINGTGHGEIRMRAGDEIVMQVSDFPIFVVLPYVMAGTVYDAEGVEAGHMADAFAVYFSMAGGSVVFAATSVTYLTYFSFKSPWTCSSYFLSSAPTERWLSGENFTIGHLQDICLVHVSDAVTEITGYYETDKDFDFLDYAGGTYTGTGTIELQADYFAAFHWHSNPVYLSSSVAVYLNSQSSLPYRHCNGSGSSLRPIILRDEPARTASRIPPTDSAALTRESSKEYASSGTGGAADQNDILDKRLMLGLLIGVPVVLAAMVAMIVVLVRAAVRRRSGYLAELDMSMALEDDSDRMASLELQEAMQLNRDRERS